MRVLDVLLAFPALLLAMVLLATVGPSDLNLILVITVLYIPMFARIARSMVLDLRTREFVEAARLRGETATLHPLPGDAAQRHPAADGGGVDPLRLLHLPGGVAGIPGPGSAAALARLGPQVNEARTFFDVAPWMLLFPAAAIVAAGDRDQPDGRRSAPRVQPARIGGGR